MANTRNLIVNIDIIKTMLSNFPDNLLDDLTSSTDSYDSVFKFMISVLESMGIDVSQIYSELLTSLYGVEYDVELTVEDLSKASFSQNKRIEGLEIAIKNIFKAFFSGIFSCSFHPFIANKFFDASYYAIGNDDNNQLMPINLQGDLDKKTWNDQLVIYRQMIDLFGMLNVCPTSQKGLSYYDVDGTYVYYKKTFALSSSEEKYIYSYTEEKDLDEENKLTLREKKTAKIVSIVPAASKLSPDVVAVYSGTPAVGLYKTTDLNAFIWYVLNIGNSIDKHYDAYNKMMWDNRNVVIRNNQNDDEFDLYGDYTEWYQRKTNSSVTGVTINNYTYEFNYPNGIFSGSTLYDDYGLRPILQLEPAKQDLYSKNLVFHIPSEIYFAPKRKSGEAVHSFNATMNRFNEDYLDSIQIFNPKFLIVRTIENLSHLYMRAWFDADISLNARLIRNKLIKTIKAMCERESTIIEDCFFEFSNDELDEILKNAELERQGFYVDKNGEIVKQNNDDVELVKFDKVEKIRKGEITVVPSDNTLGERTIEVDDGIKDDYALSVENEWLANLTLEDLITAFTMPFIESLFTPQVMLFILINMKTLGLIDESKIEELIEDTTALTKFILSKMMVIINSLVEFIKDLILQILLNIVLRQLNKWLRDYKWLQAVESTAYWLNLLTESMKCLLSYKLKLPSVLNTRPDEVNYADIREENIKELPDKATEC